jgi:pimeloyl-ACP methyl ester carboxylesterase
VAERPVRFTNDRGETLFGVLHAPDAGAGGGTGVNLLNPGLKGRVAPNRINVRIARMLCEAGVPVLRFDPHGIGDSEGQLAEGNGPNLDCWRSIQHGALVADTLAANDFFRREAGLDDVVLVGQCGGASTALLAAAGDPGVSGALLIDLPVRLASLVSDEGEPSPESSSRSGLAAELLAKALEPRSWARLLRPDAPEGSAAKALWRRVRSRLGARRGAGRPPAGGVSPRFLWPLRDACDALLGRGGRLGLVFAENDFAVRDFNRDMRPLLAGRDGALLRGVTMHVVKDANHIYTEETWQQELLEQVRRFICGGGGAPAVRRRPDRVHCGAPGSGGP